MKEIKTFDKIYQTVTINGMRELTYERARQIAMEYASQFIDKAAEVANLIDDNGDISVNEQSILSLKNELK